MKLTKSQRLNAQRFANRISLRICLGLLVKVQEELWHLTHNEDNGLTDQEKVWLEKRRISIQKTQQEIGQTLAGRLNRNVW